MRKCLAIWVVLILVSAGVAFAQGGTAVIVTVTQEVSSGIFTLVAGGSTAKVNLLNMGGVTFPTGATCAATVAFLDNTGATKYTQTVGAIGSGAAASVIFPAPPGGTYRATISYPLTPTAATGSTTPVRASCSLVPTLELLDVTTGRTMVYITQFNGVPQVSPLTPLLSRP